MYATRFVVASVLALALAVPAHAAWEAPQRIDQTAEGFGHSGGGDVAVGENGLATILFLQADDAGTKLWATRRSAGAPGWAFPPVQAQRVPTGPFAIEAAPDGATAGAWRQATGGSDIPPTPPTQNVIALGWPAAGSDAPTTADVADQDDEGLPPVDADGRGNGWTAYIDDNLNLWIVRFSLADPSKGRETFRVAPVAPAPDDQNLNETEARSNPRVDVNADGDVIVSFVEQRRIAECCDPAPPSSVDAIWAVRKLQGQAGFSAPHRISQVDEEEPVDEHDAAIANSGDATIIFAADPNREETNRVFARRWLATRDEPRPESSIEFVSSSAPSAADVTVLRAEAGPAPRVTAAWIQGGNQLNSAERTTAWTLPETLSTATAGFDLAVDVEGVATAVFREMTSVKARRRGPDQTWAPAETINTAAVPADTAPRVDAAAANEAYAYLVQADGSRRGAFATRFTGEPPVEPPAPVRPDTEDCPGDFAVLAGDAGANTISGGDPRETIMGGEGNDTLAGNGGDDCIRGQAGDDSASGGDGNDDVGGGDGNDRIVGGVGNDRITGGVGNDTMNGDSGNDVGAGGEGDDTLAGSAGNDVLNGELGDDAVRGGTGDDLLGGADGTDSVFGDAGADVLFGGLGNDSLSGGADRDTVVGEDGDDRLFGGDGPDNVNGGVGNDRVRGGSGANTLDGGDGDDGVRGGSQSDRILGSAGIDTLFGVGGHDRLQGGDDADKAYGGAGRDRLLGEAAADRLRGGNGADRLEGGDHKDSLFGDNGNDRLLGGAAGDRLTGGGSRDRISGGAGNDRIAAVDNKRDRITCGAGKDRVVADAVDVVSGSCERVRRRG